MSFWIWYISMKTSFWIIRRIFFWIYSIFTFSVIHGISNLRSCHPAEGILAWELIYGIFHKGFLRQTKPDHFLFFSCGSNGLVEDSKHFKNHFQPPEFCFWILVIRCGSCLMTWKSGHHSKCSYFFIASVIGAPCRANTFNK